MWVHVCACVCVCVGLDPEDFESEEKSDKSKNPNGLQSGKWQLGFQGILMKLKMWSCRIINISDRTFVGGR